MNKQLTRVYAIILLPIAIFFGSCGNKPVKEFPMIIASCGKIGRDKSASFPSYYGDLCNPYQATPKTKENFSPQPVIVRRLDIPDGDYPLNIAYNAKKSNTSSLEFRENMVKKFFIDNPIGDKLTKDSVASIDKFNTINNYINSLSKKSKIFYFSLNPKNDTYNDKRLFDNSDSLRSAILNSLEENSDVNIVIILNPETLQASQIIDTAKSKNDSSISGKQSIQKHKHVAVIPIKAIKIDCGSYDGNLKNGKPDGIGTLYYGEACLISIYDNKKRMSEAGDYITGHWKNGFLDVGTWYDENGNEKGKLTIGVPQ